MEDSQDKLAALRDAIEACELDYDTIKTHRDLIAAAYKSGKKPAFKILDTCRLNNGGILPVDWPYGVKLSGDAAKEKGSNVVAFTPAAGAASRYYAPLVPLIEAVNGNDKALVVAALQDLKDANAASWPLPAEVRELIEEPDAAFKLTASARSLLKSILNSPKALLPIAKDQFSFLKAKQIEHQSLGNLHADVYVTQVGQDHAFSAELDDDTLTVGAKAPLRRLFLEQGTALSTIRFLPQGEPYVDAGGAISIVPAGHGALAELFPRVKRVFPQADSIFIRNIDNVSGTSEKALGAIRHFFEAHDYVWKVLQAIRGALKLGDYDEAAKYSQQILATRASTTVTGFAEGMQRSAKKLLNQIDDVSRRSLWELQLLFFHTPLHIVQEKFSDKGLFELYQRPFNILGQVPNSGRDIGGTPCFVIKAGANSESNPEILKICLELPHASDQDQQFFLKNPDFATHFNPVFVIAEIGSDPRYYSRQNQDFWLLAEKKHRGTSVVYFETVLFELLGNSQFANTLFIEIPRILFNPHKSLEDAAKRPPLTWPSSP
jgi:hypothetical protein